MLPPLESSWRVGPSSSTLTRRRDGLMWLWPLTESSAPSSSSRRWPRRAKRRRRWGLVCLDAGFYCGVRDWKRRRWRSQQRWRRMHVRDFQPAVFKDLRSLDEKNCTLHALYFVDLSENTIKRNKFRFCEFQILWISNVWNFESWASYSLFVVGVDRVLNAALFFCLFRFFLGV